MVTNRRIVILIVAAAVALATALVLAALLDKRQFTSYENAYQGCISRCNKAHASQRAGCRAQCDAAPNLQQARRRGGARNDGGGRRNDGRKPGKSSGSGRQTGDAPRKGKKKGSGGGSGRSATANYHQYDKDKSLWDNSVYCRGAGYEKINNAKGNWMAVDPALFGNTPMENLCGKKFTVKGQKGSAQVMVVDKRGGGIDLDPKVFGEICGDRGRRDGNCKVSWS